jgi:hypothetical protein
LLTSVSTSWIIALTVGLLTINLKLASSGQVLAATITDKALICWPTLSFAARLYPYCCRSFICGHFADSHGKGWKCAAQRWRQFMEYAPQGLYTSLVYLIRTKQTATKIQPHHFRLGISGRQLIQSYGDYWQYGGLGYIPDAEKKKGKKYLEAAMRNLRAIR